MKKYSTSYPLIFGMIFFVIGIFIGQITITLLFGIVPIIISIILKWDEYDEKKQGKETSTERANRIYQAQMKASGNNAQVKKSCCARCGVDLSLLPVRKVKKIGDKKYCDVCEQIVLRAVDNKIEHQQTPQKVEVQPSPQKAEPKQSTKNTAPNVKRDLVCARCKKTISESQTVWIGNHRFCQKCANSNTDAKKVVSKAYDQKPKIDQVEAAGNVHEQIRKPENKVSIGNICSVCKRAFSDDNWIFIDGKYYCADCYSPANDETRDENTNSIGELLQISYEISGVFNRSIHSRVVEIADRLLAGGFEFYRAGFVGDANEISNNGVIAYGTSYTDYNDFKHNMERDIGQISSLDNSCICAFLARKTLKVYILSERERVILRWFDISDKAFATTKLFAETVIEEVYENQCTLKQIDNMEIQSAFLSNWNESISRSDI